MLLVGPLALVGMLALLLGSLVLVGTGSGSNFLVTLLDSGWPLALLGSYLNTSVMECLLVRLVLPTLSVRALVGLLALVGPLALVRLGSGSYVLVTLLVL